MTYFSIGNAKFVDKDGALIDIPAPGTITPPKSEHSEKVYTLSSMQMTWTFQLSPEDWERLQWVLGIHWLWRKYRQTLN